MLPDFENQITSITASAMFGEKGPENLRIGKDRPPRTLGAGWILYGFVRAVKPEIVLEVGAGGSSICILEAMKHNEKGHLYNICYWPENLSPCTDHFPENECMYFENGRPRSMEYVSFVQALKKGGYTERCTILEGKSIDLAPQWDKEVDILMVDSSHLLEDTIAEWELTKWVPPGGYAFFHDFTVCAHEVGYYIEQKVKESDDWAMIVEPDYLSLAILQRKYTYEGKNGYFMAGLYDPITNPQAYTTPVQSTDARGGKWFKEWSGRWIPKPEEWNYKSEELKQAGLELLKSGEEQSVENISRRIKEVAGGF